MLWPYSDSYKHRLAHPRNSKRRTPSGHPDELAVLSDLGGSIPPNLLAMPHSASAGRYLRYCREHGIDAHPARYPPTLPEFFIRMCTGRGRYALSIRSPAPV